MLTQFCPHCGQPLTAPGAPFCSYCGKSVVTPAPPLGTYAPGMVAVPPGAVPVEGMPPPVPPAYGTQAGAASLPVYGATRSRARRTGTKATGIGLLLLGCVIAVGSLINHFGRILYIQHATTILLAIGACLFAAGITLIMTARASGRAP